MNRVVPGCSIRITVARHQHLPFISTDGSALLVGTRSAGKRLERDWIRSMLHDAARRYGGHLVQILHR